METKPQKNPKIYIALNKPVDYSVSTDGEQNLLVSDLIIKENYAGNYNKDLNAKNYFINAPDKDSEGLAILTNDQGASAWFARLYCEYELTIGRPLIRDAKKVLEAGMNIDGEFFPGIKINPDWIMTEVERALFQDADDQFSGPGSVEFAQVDSLPGSEDKSFL